MSVILVTNYDLQIYSAQDVNKVDAEARQAFDTIAKFVLFDVEWIALNKARVLDDCKPNFAKALGQLGWTCIFDGNRIYLTLKNSTKLAPGLPYQFERRPNRYDCYVSLGSIEIPVDNNQMNDIQDAYKKASANCKCQEHK